MENDSNTIKKMHEEQAHGIIEKLQEKIDTTRYNLDVSEEIISETPSDAQREKTHPEKYSSPARNRRH